MGSNEAATYSQWLDADFDLLVASLVSLAFGSLSYSMIIMLLLVLHLTKKETTLGHSGPTHLRSCYAQVHGGSRLVGRQRRHTTGL
jgi:hypothetical protein